MSVIEDTDRNELAETLAMAPRVSGSKVALTGVRHSDAAESRAAANAVRLIIAELQPAFALHFSASEVEQCAHRAVQDLLGSICIEALPEMAIRLATVRLATRLEQPPRTTT